MSALRINLLPAYIAEVQRTKVAIGAFSALFVAAVAGTLFYYTQRDADAKAMEAKANDMTTAATNASNALNTEKAKATTLRAKIQPIKDRVDFVENIRFYNTWVEKIYRRAAQYTNKDIEYSAMAVNGTAGTLAMTGYTPSVDALSRYLITFYGNPDVTAVSVSGPPGWVRPSQSAQATNPLAGQNPHIGQGFPFSVNATLLKSLTVPQIPASLGGSPDGTGGATGGAPGAAPVGMPSGPGSSGPAGSGSASAMPATGV